MVHSCRPGVEVDSQPRELSLMVEKCSLKLFLLYLQSGDVLLQLSGLLLRCLRFLLDALVQRYFAGLEGILLHGGVLFVSVLDLDWLG